MATIEITIRPYSYRREEIQVGRMVDGQFVQEKGIWNVLKDARLSVKRSYDGRGAQQDVTFTIQVPAGYDLVIAKHSITDVSKTSPDRAYTILYDPAVIAHLFDGFAGAVQSASEESEKKEEISMEIGHTSIGYYDDEKEEWVEVEVETNLSDPDYPKDEEVPTSASEARK